jgi:transposase
MAWQRGEPRVCAMTVPPSPSKEDCRRISRERAKLLQERVRHTNRIRGLLFGQGITNYNPLHKRRRKAASPSTATRRVFASQTEQAARYRPTPTAQNRRFEFSFLSAESRTIGSVRGFQL